MKKRESIIHQFIELFSFDTLHFLMNIYMEEEQKYENETSNVSSKLVPILSAYRMRKMKGPNVLKKFSLIICKRQEIYRMIEQNRLLITLKKYFV